MPLTPELIARRDRAAARHDRALERFPNREGSTFANELDAVIGELRLVTAALGPSDAGTEVSRCFRWLGDACFDRGNGRDRSWLEQGRSAYLRAESALGAGELVERAKLDFNFGNTLRGLSGGTDPATLREAQRRYRRALDTFSKHVPNLATAAESALAATLQQIELAERRDALADGMRRDLKAAGLGPDRVTEQVFAALKKRFEQDVSAGRVSPARQADIVRLLGRLEGVLAEQPHDDLKAMALWSDRMRELMKAFTALLENRQIGGAGTGDVGLTAGLKCLQGLVSREMTLPQRPAGERDVCWRLFVELSQLQGEVGDGVDAARALELERSRLRPLAREWRRYACRHRVVLAEPVRFPRDVVEPEPNTVLWLGSDRLKPDILGVCRQRGFRLFDGSQLGASERAWVGARSSMVVVAELEGQRGPAWASPCYVLGLAACAGAPVVLLLQEGETPPFDLDVPPIYLRSPDDHPKLLAERIDAAVYERRAGNGSDSTLAETLENARARFPTGPISTLFRGLGADDVADAIKVRALLEQALGVAGAGAPLLLTPILAVPYADRGRPSCFHVTPFDRPGEPARFEVIRSVANRACEAAGFRYLHGAESTEGQILSAIWHDIGISTHVLVDLTDLNPNVAYELAIAHALGRQVLVIGESGTERRLFPAVAKERITTYDAERPLPALEPAFNGFLRQR